MAWASSDSPSASSRGLLSSDSVVASSMAVHFKIRKTAHSRGATKSETSVNSGLYFAREITAIDDCVTCHGKAKIYCAIRWEARVKLNTQVRFCRRAIKSRHEKARLISKKEGEYLHRVASYEQNLSWRRLFALTVFMADGWFIRWPGKRCGRPRALAYKHVLCRPLTYP